MLSARLTGEKLFAKNFASLSRQQTATSNRRFQFQKSRQLFIRARTTKRFPSSRCASAIQIVRPLEAIAEKQPQLQPALLSRSAMRFPSISNNYREATVGVP